MITEQDSNNWRDLCGICGQPVRFWHDSLTETDDLITTTWHRRCARNHKEWAWKVTHLFETSIPSATPLHSSDLVDRWDRFYKSLDSKKRK